MNHQADPLSYPPHAGESFPQEVPCHRCAEVEAEMIPLSFRETILFLIFALVLMIPALIGLVVIVRWLWRAFHLPFF